MYQQDNGMNWGNPWKRQGTGSSYYGATSNGTSRSPWSFFDAGTTDLLRNGYMTGFTGGLMNPMQGYYDQMMNQMNQMNTWMQNNSMPNGTVNFQNGYYGMPDMTPNDGINQAGLIDTNQSTWTSDNPNNPYNGFDMNQWNQYNNQVKTNQNTANTFVNDMYQNAGVDTTRDGDFNVFTDMYNSGYSQDQIQDRFNNWQNTGSIAWSPTTQTAAPATTPSGNMNDVFAMATGYQPDQAAQTWINSMQTAGLSPTQIISAITKAQQG